MKSRQLGSEGMENIQKNMVIKYKKLEKELNIKSKEIGDMSFLGITPDGLVRVIFNGEKIMMEVNVDIRKFIEKMEKEGLIGKLQEDVLEKIETVFETLSDLIVVAANDAMRKVDNKTDEEISKITKGMNIQLPGVGV